MQPPITIDDLTTRTTTSNGAVVPELSPSKAAKSLCDKLTLVMTGGDDSIWYFDGQIYQNQGKEYIKDLIYSTAGDLVDKRQVNEVLDRIGSKLRLSPVTFNPNPSLLGVDNGVIDCSTGSFRPYARQDLITDKLPVIYNKNARCPEIIKFIEGITPSSNDRITLIDIIASGAYRKALHYIAFLIGHGSSGSSTLIHLLQAFYGAENTEAIPLNELVERPFALSSLKNARYSIGQEIEAVKKAGTSRIKEISGGDWISADVKNKDRARFQGWTKLIFKGNAVPRFADTTWAFRRRFVEIKLPYKFVPEVDPDEPNQRKMDPDIEEKITTPEELSGLLNLLLTRLPTIIRNKRIHQTKGQYEEYRQQVDSVTSFLDLFCAYYPESISVRIPIKDIYTNFQQWCDLVIGNSVDYRQFGKYVKHHCENRSGLETTIEGKTVTVYQGLTFDQDRFNEVIKNLQTGLTPDGTGLKTGLEHSQQTLITGCTGLESNVEATWGKIHLSFGPLYGEECENGRNDPFLPVSDSKRSHGNPVFNPLKPDVHPVPSVVEEFMQDGGRASLKRFLAEFPEAAE
jgi:putative DNA primase/helicase